MKILLITEFFPTGKDLRFSGGVEARTFFIAKGLAKRNKVFVIASRTKGMPTKENTYGFTVLRVGPKRNYTASTGHVLSRLLFIKDALKIGKSLDVDIVDGGNYIAHFIARNIADNKKIPVVAWYPDVWLNDWIKNTGFTGLFGEFLERLNLIRGFNAYIAISKVTAMKLEKFAKGKIYTIYCGVQNKEFEKGEKKFKNPTILCVSRLTSYKNIKTLIFAFAHLSSRIKDLRLIIVGTGPQLYELKHLAENLEVSGKVKFLSNLPRKTLLNLYKSSHVFSLPSLVEGFGIATIEAAIAGLPYVNSDIPIQREITKGGKGGYLVDPLNPIAYSDKFKTLVENRNQYQKKSKEAQNLANNYDWNNAVIQTEKVYYSLLNK